MKSLLLSIFLITIIGCQNYNNRDETKEALFDKIHKLEEENTVLKDSISNIEKTFLWSQILIGIPDKEVMKVGEKTRIAILFQTFDQELPEYEIYKIDGDKEIKVGTNNKTAFDYNFTPKSIKDDRLKLIVKMPYRGKTITIPAEMNLRIKE